jgi:hypothetical protein
MFIPYLVGISFPISFAIHARYKFKSNKTCYYYDYYCLRLGHKLHYLSLSRLKSFQSFANNVPFFLNVFYFLLTVLTYLTPYKN